MADAKKLIALGVAPETAKELAKQINSAAKDALVSVTPITTANATDLATAQALANDTKSKFNALLAALKA